MTTSGVRFRLPIAHLPSVVLPGAVLTIPLATDELRRAVEATAGGALLFTGGDEHELAVLARVPDMGSLPTGEPVAIVQVETRARVVAIDRDERGADVAEYEVLRDPRPSPSLENVARELRAVLELIADLRRSRRLPELLRRNLDPGALADAVALWAEFDDAARLAVLRAVDVAARVELVMAWARGHLAELQVAQAIRDDVSEGVDKQQREFLLRQQLAAIRKELGEDDDDVVGEYRTRLADLDAPDSVRNAIDKELERLERTSTQSPEHSWIRTWLDRIFELPWNNRSDDNVDLGNAKRVLDDDHYGLDDVKDRIVEFLATRKLRHERGLDERESDSRRGNGAIVTLVGPPGVGKTSLGESVARRWDASSCASRSVASGTKPRSAATAAPTSGRSRDASSAPSSRRAR